MKYYFEISCGTGNSRTNYFHDRITVIKWLISSDNKTRHINNFQYFFIVNYIKKVNQNHYFIVKGNLHREKWASKRITVINWLITYYNFDEDFKINNIKKIK